MSAVNSVGAKRVELTEEQVHLIAKALADPRRLEVLRQMLEADREVERCRALAAKLRPNGKSQTDEERKQVETVLQLIGK